MTAICRAHGGSWPKREWCWSCRRPSRRLPLRLAHEGTLSKASLRPIAEALHARATPETLAPQARATPKAIAVRGPEIGLQRLRRQSRCARRGRKKEPEYAGFAHFSHSEAPSGGKGLPKIDACTWSRKDNATISARRPWDARSVVVCPCQSVLGGELPPDVGGEAPLEVGGWLPWPIALWVAPRERESIPEDVVGSVLDAVPAASPRTAASTAPPPDPSLPTRVGVVMSVGFRPGPPASPRGRAMHGRVRKGVRGLRCSLMLPYICNWIGRTYSRSIKRRDGPVSERLAPRPA